jgi:hypothetical protein
MDGPVATTPSDQDTARSQRSDKPPVLRFLLLFALLLAAALGLATLTPAAAEHDPTNAGPPAQAPISMEKPA